jgi:uncharacterized protein (DUF983 family)
MVKDMTKNIIRHCKYCKDGRVIENRQKHIIFCTLCGREYRK